MLRFELIVISVLLSNALCANIRLSKNKYCYANDRAPYKYLATKTAYEIIHGTDFPTRIPKCEPIQFWSINRHGTRLPGNAAIKGLKTLTKLKEQILNNYENEIPNTKPDGLCEEDIELFENWEWNNTISRNISSNLTPQGWRDLKLIALRNKARFSELLSLPYTEKDFLFRYTRTQRTEASFKAYAQGLFGTESSKVHGISYENDTLIQTYKHCKFWQESVDENPDSLIEYNKFLETQVYKDLIINVSKRLGFNVSMTQDDIKNMFDMCRFEQAWYVDDKSVWCAAFTKEHLEILEYAEDLLYYYLIGHGIPLNAKVGCMPLKDMMARFENAVKGDLSQPKGIFYFSHSSALQLLMVAMEMNVDKIPLKGNNMNEQQNRKWRTSLIGPFAANIDVVLYKCSKGDTHRVVFYLNEKSYSYTECSIEGHCSWEYVKRMFSKIADSCNLDFCKNDDDIYRVKH